MWYLFVLLIGGWIAWAVRAFGRRWALGSAVALSLLLPTWVTLRLGPTVIIDLRIAAAAIALLVYCAHPRTRWRGPLLVADFVILALCLVHVAADIVNDGFQWLLPLRAYGEWALPYVAGRLAVQNFADARRLLPVACAISVVLGLWSMAEAVFRVDPINYLVGQRPAESDNPSTLRMGFKRAEGPARHAIYFGMLQVLLWPWTLQIARSQLKGTAAVRRWPLPVISVGGVLATMSRGPMLALGVVLYLLTILRWPRLRIPLLIVAAVAVLLLAWQRERVLRNLHAWAGETELYAARRIVVDGQQVEYSGTMQRYYLWKVYAKAMWRHRLVGVWHRTDHRVPGARALRPGRRRNHQHVEIHRQRIHLA